MDPLARRRIGRTHVEVTQLGFGGAGLGDLFEVIPEAQAAATLQAAWDAGIRYLLGVPAGFLGNEFAVRFGLRATAMAVFLVSSFATGLFGLVAMLPFTVALLHFL